MAPELIALCGEIAQSETAYLTTLSLSSVRVCVCLCGRIDIVSSIRPPAACSLRPFYSRRVAVGNCSRPSSRASEPASERDGPSIDSARQYEYCRRRTRRLDRSYYYATLPLGGRITYCSPSIRPSVCRCRDPSERKPTQSSSLMELFHSVTSSSGAKCAITNDLKTAMRS